MERIYGWFGSTGPTLPGEAQEVFYRSKGEIAGKIGVSGKAIPVDSQVPWFWDSECQTVYLSRTTQEELPVYFACQQGTLIFSSQLPWLLLQLDRVATAIDPYCLADLAIIGFIAPPRTQYQGVYQLPPSMQIQWPWGEEKPRLVSLAGPLRVPLALGVTVRQSAGKKSPEVIQLSDNVMMYNAIQHSASMLGESHCDPAMLRLSLRLRLQRTEFAHFRLDSDELTTGFPAEHLLSASWLKRRWRQRLHHYWMTTRVPEIQQWFFSEDSTTESEWNRALIITERQRIIRQMVRDYHQQAEFYFTSREAELSLSALYTKETFCLDAPEAGNLFCYAVRLGKTSANINDYVSLCAYRLRSVWSDKKNTQLIRILSAISSLDYLDKFSVRLPN